MIFLLSTNLATHVALFNNRAPRYVFVEIFTLGWGRLGVLCDNSGGSCTLAVPPDHAHEGREPAERRSERARALDSWSIHTGHRPGPRGDFDFQWTFGKVPMFVLMVAREDDDRWRVGPKYGIVVGFVMFMMFVVFMVLMRFTLNYYRCWLHRAVDELNSGRLGGGCRRPWDRHPHRRSRSNPCRLRLSSNRNRHMSTPARHLRVLRHHKHGGISVTTEKKTSNQKEKRKLTPYCARWRFTRSLTGARSR